jgi:hypothetical protein
MTSIDPPLLRNALGLAGCVACLIPLPPRHSASASKFLVRPPSASVLSKSRGRQRLAEPGDETFSSLSNRSLS